MLSSLLNYQEQALLLVRIALAIIFIRHGYPKVMQPKPGFKVLGVLEMLAALSVGLGVFVQVGALFMCFVMAGAMYFKIAKWKTPFFTMTATGWEFDFLIFFAALLVATHSGANYSLMM